MNWKKISTIIAAKRLKFGGYTNKEIAEALKISKSTVRKYIKE